MTIAHVVPLRRLPIDHPWFDYAIPAGLSVQPGHLVEVLFRHRPILGIVWSLAHSTDVANVTPITRVVLPQPVITPWLHAVVEAIVDQTFVSYGHLLRSFVPTLTKKIPDIGIGTIPEASEALSTTDKIQTLWYRQRRQALDLAVSWLRAASATPRVVITPTIQDAEMIFRSAQVDGTFLCHSKIGVKAFRQGFFDLLSGRMQRIVGTGQAIALPYRQPPDILLDQEEHPSHKITEQNPRIDWRLVLAALHAPAQVTSPAPSIRWYQSQRPQPPPVIATRKVISLNQPLPAAWVTEDALTLIDDARDKKSRVLAIVPRRGYASSAICADCGHSAVCPRCRRQIGLFASGPSELTCSFCRYRGPLPASCANCRGKLWRFRGLGPERFAESLRRVRPTVTASFQELPRSAPGVVIGTYQIFRSVDPESIAGILVVSGDGMLQLPDYSAAERAWQYLSRLQSVFSRATMLVQTFSPDQDFWQRWQNGDDRSWYEQELRLRQKLQLPPFRDQWIIRYIDPVPGPAEKQLRAVLADFCRAGGELRALPEPGRTLRRRQHRWLLIAPPGKRLRRLIDMPACFPYPWNIDTSIQSWLD